MVYGGTTEQLKAICSSMEDCEGFNSEGWVKSRVDSKKRASIDLYVKQGVTGKQMTGLRITDMDAGVYSKHIKDYDEMEQDMRVYLLEGYVFICILVSNGWLLHVQYYLDIRPTSTISPPLVLAQIKSYIARSI